jgi:hypothetical protein
MQFTGVDVSMLSVDQTAELEAAFIVKFVQFDSAAESSILGVKFQKIKTKRWLAVVRYMDGVTSKTIWESSESIKAGFAVKAVTTVTAGTAIVKRRTVSATFKEETLSCSGVLDEFDECTLATMGMCDGTSTFFDETLLAAVGADNLGSSVAVAVMLSTTCPAACESCSGTSTVTRTSSSATVTSATVTEVASECMADTDRFCQLLSSFCGTETEITSKCPCTCDTTGVCSAVVC